jgi:hypothetical protein
MNDHLHNNGNGGFEREDLGPKSVYSFLIILAVVVAAAVFAARGLYRGLDHYYEAHQPAQAPLKPTTEVDTRDTQTGKATERIENTFSQPLLETDERDELNNFRTQEEIQLNSYGWVDQKAGVVRIPIERAMQLVAQRGLPARPAETKPTTPGKAVPSGKKTAANPAGQE